MKNRFIAAITAGVMISASCGTVFAGVESAVYDGSNIVVSGTTSQKVTGERFSLMLHNMYDASSPAESVVIAEQGVSGENGSFTYTIPLSHRIGDGNYTLRYGDASDSAEEVDLYIDRVSEEFSVSISEAGHIFFDPSDIKVNIAFVNGETMQTGIVARVYTEDENELVFEDMVYKREIKAYEKVSDTLTIDLTNATRPYFLCEFCHALGLGPGEQKLYWDLIYSSPQLIGGCIWEWCDHAYLKEFEDGTKGYIYGGDSGDFPNDGYRCCDGIVFPDRTPQTGLLEFKKVIEPVKITCIDAEKGIFKIENRYDFTNLEELDVEYRIIADGEIIKREVIDINLAPHEKTMVTIAPEKSITAKHCAYAEIYVLSKEDTLWCKKGHEIAWAQGDIPTVIEKEDATLLKSISLSKS